MNDSPASASAPVPPTLELSELPAGWQQAERDEWADSYPASGRRRLALRVAVGVLLVAGVLGALVWVAAGRYARGVDALNDGAYSRAAAELSGATVLVFPYRDARALEEQARQALQAETAAREAEESVVNAVVAQLQGAGARFDAGDAAGVLAALEAIPADELRSAVRASDEGRASVAALREDLAGAASTALGNAQWQRAGRFAAALLVLEPSSDSAADLAARARTGEQLSAKLTEARAAASAGRWREALRLALAVLAVRKEFPGAAAVVADARVALKPKPKPRRAPRRHAGAARAGPGHRRIDGAPTATAAAMRRPPSIRRLSRAGLLVGLAACLAALWFGAAAAGAGAATAPWSPVVLPWGASWAVYDVYAFGATGLAVTGDEGHIGVTQNGGATWKVVVPDGFGATAFTAIALSTSGHGAVASGGQLLVTDDGGDTWHAPVYIGPGPGAAINDIALRGSRVVAVGDDGLIMSSTDAGATWQQSESPTQSALSAVAIAGDGTSVAGSAAGEVLVDSAGVWVLAGATAGPVTSVAASPDPVWGDGQPDLIAAGAADVLGSDDALAFATLPGLPDPISQPWSRVAWSGVPERSLLIAGASRAGFFETLGHQWVAGPSGLGAAACAVAPAGQSVAYLLGADGALVRTLSACREPATAALSRPRIVVGASTGFTATVRVAAPGKVVLLSRVPGRSWVTQRSVAWTAGDWNRSLSFSLRPSLTQEYSLVFQYGTAQVQVAQPGKVVVKPRVTTARSRYDLRAGNVFRFSGSVTPELQGERIELFTDRGGSWRPVSLQRSVKLQDGRTWTSRPFGTPKAEVYHLKARVVGTSAHDESWSRVVTVSIRR